MSRSKRKNDRNGGSYTSRADEAHHSRVDDCEILVDYNRQQLMPGWIPRRLGGGLGGMKGSGQLRFGGRERPFRAPLKSIPFEDLKRLGIPPPPEGRYMTLYQVPSPPRRRRNSVDREDKHSHSHTIRRRRNSVDREEEYSHSHKRTKPSHRSRRRRSTSRNHLTDHEEKRSPSN